MSQQPSYSRNIEDQVNNNRSSGGAGDYHGHSRQEKSNWAELLLDSSERHDSGHFTVSPDVDHPGGSESESSRSHSPTSNNGNNTNSRGKTPTSAALVLQACRERKISGPGDPLPKTYAYLSRSESSTISNNPSTSQWSTTTIETVEDSEELYSCSSTPSVGYLKTALDNFNALYQEKLQMVDEIGAGGDAATKQKMVEKKANILECWAKDVCVQNIVLIHTVEELERQGEKKFKMLQQKVNESSSLAKKHKSVVESYEQRIDSLLKDRATSRETEKGLRNDLEKVKNEYRRIRGSISQLEKDNDSLVTLVTRIRDMGVWDVDGLEFHKRTFAHMFELYPHLPGSEVQTVFTREKAKRFRETEDTIQQLEAKVKELESFSSEAGFVIKSKDSKIIELESEIKLISSKLQQCQEECDHYKNALIDTQEKLLQASKELQIRSKVPSRPNTPDSARRHSETQELLQELRNVKTQLTKSMQESQSAKEEANMIRREFSERLRAMQESQQCLKSELSQSFESHQSKDFVAEIEKVQERAQLYQSQCEKTEKQLNAKDKIIDDLHNTIQQLNHKPVDFTSGDCQRNLVRSKTPASVASYYPSFLKCGRDRSFKPTVITQEKMHVSNDSKPPWNDHFIKSSVFRASNHSFFPASQDNSFNISSCQSHSKQNFVVKNINATKTCSSGEKHQQPHCSRKNRFSLCSCAAHDFTSNELLDTYSTSTTPTKRNVNLSMPNIDIHLDLKQKRKDTEAVTATELRDDKNIAHKSTKQSSLDRNSKEIPNNEEKKEMRDQIKCPQLQEPLQTSTYQLLMGVAVEASKKLLDSENNRLSSIRVVAGHRKHNSNNNNSNQRQKHGSKTFPVHRNHVSKLNDRTQAEDKSFADQKSIPPHLSKSLQELLTQLPSQSYINVVQEWIQTSPPETKKSPEAIACQKFERTNQKPATLRKSMVRPISNARPISNSNAKKTITRLSNEKSAFISSGKIYAAKTRQIEKDISDIKEEWNRIFANIDQSHETATVSSLEDGQVTRTFDEGVVVLGNDKTLVADFIMNTSSSVTDYKPEPGLLSLKEERSQLIQQFKLEKAQLQEAFRKTLSDKDVEITMQKNYMDDGVGVGAQVCLSELVNAHDDFKSEATRQLHGLINDNNALSTASISVKKRIKLFDHLIKAKQFEEEFIASLPGADAASYGNERQIAGHLARQIRQLMAECSSNSSQLNSLKTAVESMECFGSEIKDEIVKMQWELQLMTGVHKNSLTQLEQSNFETQQLKSENELLKAEKAAVEEKLLSTNIELEAIKTANATTDHCAMMQKDLEQMKEAFDKKEELMIRKNEEVLEKDRLIKKYEEYCTKAQAYIERVSQLSQTPDISQQIFCQKDDISESLQKKVLSLEEENLQLRNLVQWYKVELAKRLQAVIYGIFNKLPFSDESRNADASESSQIAHEKKIKLSEPTFPYTGSGDATVHLLTRETCAPNIPTIQFAELLSGLRQMTEKAKSVEETTDKLINSLHLK